VSLPERRARQAQSPRGHAEGLLQRRAPGPIFAAMVDLVEDDECTDGESPNGGWIERYLLIGNDHAVHVGGQAAVGY
jgi:hypothetical protein